MWVKFWMKAGTEARREERPGNIWETAVVADVGWHLLTALFLNHAGPASYPISVRTMGKSGLVLSLCLFSTADVLANVHRHIVPMSNLDGRDKGFQETQQGISLSTLCHKPYYPYSFFLSPMIRHIFF